MIDCRIIPHCAWVRFEDLRDRIPFAQYNVRVFGREVLQPRLVHWYGPVAYTYSGLTLPSDPMPPWLEELRERVSEAAGAPFDSVLCNLYRNGKDAVGWHSDDEELFGPDPVVASLSYGASRRFVLRRKADRHSKTDYYLNDGTLLVMGKGVQREYQHTLPKTSRPVGERINLTFRQTVPSTFEML
jgi:alkylated DNA repair dioxygenase AlkB